MSEESLILYIVISVLLSLLFALGVVWFLNHAQKKLTQSKIKEQQLALDYQRKMLENTVRTKEIERKRISQELHDDVSSQLSIINLNLHVLKNKLPNDQHLEQLVDQMQSSIKKSSERTRTISHELMPLSFKKFGLHYVLEDLASSINLLGEISITIDSDYLIRIRDNFKLLHIYRIIQELVNNTLKYAKAKNINIQFVEEENDLVMLYTDDGEGFEFESDRTGLGFGNITTRATLLDGHIKFESSEGSGFRATLNFPNYE